MTPNDEFIGQLESYLDQYEGSTPLPESVRYAIRAELPSIRQTPRGRGLGLLTLTMQMPSAARYGLLAAAMAAAAVFGASWFGRGIGSPEDATPTTPPPRVTPVALPSAASLEPGTYVIANPYLDEDPIRSCDRGCSDYQTITLTVPAGWATADGLIYKHLNEPSEVALSVWTPGGIYLDPCRWQTSEIDSDPSAHTDDGNDIVLGDQHPLLNQLGRAAAAPTNVMLGGERALRIELSIPADLDIAGCDQGEFRSWTEWDVPGGANSHHAAGQVDVLYFVDVDRRTLFIDASHMPAASAADLAELEAILDSMFIERGF